MWWPGGRRQFPLRTCINSGAKVNENHLLSAMPLHNNQVASIIILAYKTISYETSCCKCS